MRRRRVAKVLGTDQVLRVKRLNLADDTPFAVVTVWCPAELGHHLSRRDVESHPFYELLGVALRGATQTIGADSVDGADATLLGVPAGSPVLRCERITTDTHGRAVLMSEHVFPAAHGVRGRAAPGGALHRPQRPPVGGVAHRRCHVVGDRARAT